MSKGDQTIYSSDDALENYLDALLDVSEGDDEKKTGKNTLNGSAEMDMASPVNGAAQATELSSVEGAPLAEEKPSVVEEPLTETIYPIDEKKSVEDASLSDEPSTGLECFLINVAGVTLAVRREGVLAVMPWPTDYTTVNYQHGQIGGEWVYEGKKVALVDTARVILPNPDENGLSSLSERAHEVLLIGDGSWGIASGTASQTCSIDAECVHWCGQNSHRPWLAGMVSDPRCALLDTAGLMEQLKEPDIAEQCG